MVAPVAGLSAADQVIQVLARATAAGLPLAQAVEAYGAEYPEGQVRRALRSLGLALERGVPLEAAVRQVRPVLPEYVGGLVRAATESGRLAVVLEQHLRAARRTRDLKFRFWLSAAYPLALLALAFAVVLMMLIVFVPQFADMFLDFGVQLPPATQWTLALSRFLIHVLPYWPYAVAAMFVVAAAIYAVRFLPGRAARVRLWQMVPLFGSASLSIGMSELCGLLMLLVECGVPLPKALRLTGGALRDPNLADGCRKLAEQCEQGLPADQEAAYLPNFPDSLPPVFRWEGRPDALASGLRAAAELYAAQSRVRIWVAASFIQPIVLAIVVLIVGGVAITLFLPVMKLLGELTMWF